MKGKMNLSSLIIQISAPIEIFFNKLLSHRNAACRINKLSHSDERCWGVFLKDFGYGVWLAEGIHFRRLKCLTFDLSVHLKNIGALAKRLMKTHLMQFELNALFRFRSLDKLTQKASEVCYILENAKPTHSSLALVMVAAGALRAVNRSGSSGFLNLKNSAEEFIEFVAKLLISKTKSSEYDGNNTGINLLLQLMSLALARSGSVSYKDSILVSLALALLNEVFPLQRIYNKVLKFPEENCGKVLDEIKDHLNSVIFKEAGAITGVFCNQYALADEDSRSIVENLIWDYCQKVYLCHRQTAVMLVGRGDNVIKEIEKVAESAFLMVVVFALGVTKYRLDAKINREPQLEISVRILVSFSCMEYFRRMRLPEYMDTIRAVIVSVQENESACVSFVESIPSYDDLTNNYGSSNSPKLEYLWSTDEVQTARVIFYMRVIPTCVERLPASVFKKMVAPTMFLYIGHPNGKVTRYSHSVFVAFISSGKDPNQDERDLLKEQLVFYYVQRSLEGYPGITPFEGMASGVAALVRHLPAGSPSIFYCIHSLVEKATTLCSTVSSHDNDLWKNWEGELEPAKKVIDLLLRLLSLVDIQVLPSLMKLLAQLMVQLPTSGQNMLLNQLYEQVAESDDVIRKPTLISWLQSLSYLCSQEPNKLVRKTASASTMGSITLNGVNARL
ncbi:hypothetical protein BUALT_Bualt05G0066300 [Buddleja alternifolia]|uniref:Uncharacterized protein n=1 Tax=Buddleja alternifolia TaxID=168488 RepID=A0AAV6XH20_9LAMI|nr:hypothetical protein BUALT_Bualt05G0066300 [Buddleja alternifolia]